MTDLRKAAQQALEALEWISSLQTGGMIQGRAIEPQAGLRMALEQQQAEPVYRKGCAECDRVKQVQEADDEWKADLAKGRKILAQQLAAQPQQQAEPVAEKFEAMHANGNVWITTIGAAAVVRNTHTSREWQGLTDEEIKAAWSQLWCDINKMKLAADDRPQKETVGFIFAKAIEAKLKERNT